MIIDFELKQGWIDSRKEEHVLLVARKICEIQYGAETKEDPPRMRSDGTVVFPLTNNYWLYPPGRYVGQAKGHWRLAARYDNMEKLTRLVEALNLALDAAQPQ